ncbi:protein CHROMATIN REMODELING 20-like isoform X3 [Tasmannia lanceolata]|uniref:protein CHROMATIN REMODELING 20-like isoform X3 n=1 Tax=Tasmannia lanceolata TaxID=3420 RepID=UPI0040649AA7
MIDASESSSMNEMKDEQKGAQDAESDSNDSFIDDSDDEPSTSEIDEEPGSEALLTDAEIEEIISEFFEVESKAAEAQESLEKESLAQVESLVRAELAQTLHGDLELAVSTEMKTFIEDWETTLDDLEAESALLLEQLDGAGIELPSLYKWIESQAPNGCCTDAWKKRAHWVGSQITTEVTESISNAEKYLQSCRPVRRQHGRLLEEGASGFLGKKLVIEETKEMLTENSEKDWSSFSELIQSHRAAEDNASFGSKHWACVYLASTPQQAANMGLKLPGVDEVEEINDIESNSGDPFYADAVANEKEIDLSEEQKKNFRKVKEEDDANIAQKLQLQLKRQRRKNRKFQETNQKEVCSVDRILESGVCDSLALNESSHFVSAEKSCSEIGEDQLVEDKDGSLQHMMADTNGSLEPSDVLNKEKKILNGTFALTELTELSGSKHSHDDEDLEKGNKKSRTVIIDSDDEVHVVAEKSAYEVIDIVSPSPVKSYLRVSDDAEDFHCTACSRVLGACEVHRHPLFEVIVCENCKCFIEQLMQQKDPDCSECYCGWCGRSNDLINCKSCKSLFCTICIRKNFGEERLSELQASGWHCCCCSPSLLQNFIREYNKALQVGDKVASCSDSDSELSDTDIHVSISNKKRRKRRIRRILDDTELGEETKRKIAIEKARQEHLKSLQVQFAGKSWSNNTASYNGNATEGASADVLGDAMKGYIVNVVREEDEEPVRIPPSVSAKLKPHQIAGIRFIWENIIQSVRQVKSGDRGLGCILAHTMGLGKTFQVIAFLYTAMRSVDLGLRTALIVTPVNVLHNWRQEFIKWRPLDFKPLRVFMLEDVSRDRRAELLAKWRAKGGVLLIGYVAFRNLSLGKNKDKNMALEISHALLIWNHPGLLQMAKHRDNVSREDAIENLPVDDSSSDENMDCEIPNEEKAKSKNGDAHKRTENGSLNEEIDWWKDLLHEKIYKEVDYSGKMVLLLDILSMSSDVGDKALVFSQSLPTLDLIEFFLSKLPRQGREGKCWKQGKDWYRLDGSTEGSERQRLVERFNEATNKRVKCVLISTRAGSLGINLHAANRVILVDGSWNPTHDLQAIYRVWRYGQNKPVYAYRLMAHGTMEEKIYKRQVTKEGLAARVVDRQQVHRTMSKEEVLHLFDFGDDENAVEVPEKDQEIPVPSNQDTIEVAGFSQQKLLSQGSCSSDKFMENLLSRHYPRWIANYHEHETLLQENEEERLSKEEQDMAWEVFQRSLEWEEVQRVSLDDSKPMTTAPIMENSLRLTKSSLRNCLVQRKCTNLAHMLTLRSQGTKQGSSTICGECTLEISWENKDGMEG